MGTKRTLCALLAVFLFVNSYADVITKTYHFSNPAVKQFENYHILKQENPVAFVNEIQIYPNPARHKIFINTLHGQLQKAQMQIISQSGKVVYSQEISNSDTPVEVDNSKLSSGVYTVLLLEGESVFRKKFIKIN